MMRGTRANPLLFSAGFNECLAEYDIAIDVQLSYRHGALNEEPCTDHLELKESQMQEYRSEVRFSQRRGINRRKAYYNLVGEGASHPMRSVSVPLLGYPVASAVKSSPETQQQAVR